MKIVREGLLAAEIALRETLFHTANGYLGVRASLEEGVPPGVRTVRGTYINGFYDTAEIPYGEKLYGFADRQQSLVNLPDVQTVRLTLGGEPYDPFQGEVELFEQVLDMEAGLYTRRVIWRSPLGRRTALRFERMASFAMPELFTLRIEAQPLDWRGEIVASSVLSGDVYNDFDPADPRKAAEKKRRLTVEAMEADGESVVMRCRTIGSGLCMACAVRHTADGVPAGRWALSANEAACVLAGEASAARPFALVKWCAMADSRRHGADTGGAALARLAEAAAEPLETWYARQAAFLAAFWETARVEVGGDDALQASLQFSLYSLLQSAGQDGVSSIAAKGLSGEGYEGHYFWDTEIYMLPFFLLTQPDMARRLLDYRASILESAREQARLLGHARGALYAWRTIAGAECSAYFPSGSAQYHINGDIAHAFIQYYQATGDLGYMETKGLEVLIETARLWLDVGHWADGTFHIDCVTGPDEYTCVVNDNYYTNRSAQFHLRWTVRLCGLLEAVGRFAPLKARLGVTDGELTEMDTAARGICLPFDKVLGICAQDDSFLSKKRLDLAALPKEKFPLLLHYHPLFLYRHQVCKQADTVLAHLLFEEGVDEAVLARTFAYYEAVTTHDSSLSPCVFSMMAARVGEVDKAYAYYDRTSKTDLLDTHGNTADGIHAANMGGAYMGIVLGFAGLRIAEEGISLRPRIPDQWTHYRFSLRYQGALLAVTVDRTGTTIEHREGGAARVRVYEPTPNSFSIF